MPAVAARMVEVDELDEGSFVQFDSLLGGDFLQRAVDVGEMVGGDVADEGAGDFVVAHAAVQPAEKENELDGDGRRGGEPGEVVHEHGRSNEVKRIGPAR